MQLAPATRLAPQVVLVWLNSAALVPVIATLSIASAEPPVLVSVSACGTLVVPTTNSLKLRLAVRDSNRQVVVVAVPKMRLRNHRTRTIPT